MTEGRQALWCRRQIWRQDFVLSSTSASTVSQKKEKTETFTFQLPISSPPSAAATDTVLMQGFTFIIWKAARQVKNMQMWHIKKRQEVCYNIPEWPSSTAEPHHHGNKQCPDFLIYPCATQAITANNSGFHLILWIYLTLSLSKNTAGFIFTVMYLKNLQGNGNSQKRQHPPSVLLCKTNINKVSVAKGFGTPSQSHCLRKQQEFQLATG